MKTDAAFGKVLLITGGNNGIGFFTVSQWLEDGGKAAVLDLADDNLGPLKDRYPDSLISVICDVSDDKAVKDAVRKTLGAFGQIDFAVHNACICPFKSLEELKLDDYRRVMDVNFFGAVILTKAVLPYMLERNSGSVCYTSSGVGVSGFINISSYASSKGAIEAFAKCMRLEYKDTGISFHILHPPLTDTKSSAPLPVPREFKASAEKVGRGFAARLSKKKFIIAPSGSDAFSVRMTYQFPLAMGGLLTKLTKNAGDKGADKT
jgi:NAD(P)-dependent dehydrogenase (short-subunit alcohol dehydrogenase family)